MQHCKIFWSDRPAEMNVPDAPFFLAVRHGKRQKHNYIWFVKPASLGMKLESYFLTKVAEGASVSDSDLAPR